MSAAGKVGDDPWRCCVAALMVQPQANVRSTHACMLSVRECASSAGHANDLHTVSLYAWLTRLLSEHATAQADCRNRENRDPSHRDITACATLLEWNCLCFCWSIARHVTLARHC